MNTRIINQLNKKYNTKFVLLQQRGFNSVYTSQKYILNIFPDGYNLNDYKNNYELLSKIHTNIPKIILWNIDERYYIQKKIENTIDDWYKEEHVYNFFNQYLSNIFRDPNNDDSLLYHNVIKKMHGIYQKQKDINKKLIVKNLINEIVENKEFFQGELSAYIHGDLSDSNILLSNNNYYLIDFENVTNFDIYYDLVSFDYFTQHNHCDIYKKLFSQNNRGFHPIRYEIMKKLFNFIQQNNLGNLI